MTRILSVAPVKGSIVDRPTAEAIFEQINRFAGYGFNKSHAAAYADISFRTAYLKAHHPEAFYAAAMNLDLDNVEEIAMFASEMKIRGIALMAPGINSSQAGFAPLALRKTAERQAYAISYGLSALRGVGEAAARDIVVERHRRGAFLSLKDFLDRLGTRINRKAATSLALAGAFDDMVATRADAVAEISGTKKLKASAGQISMFDVTPGFDTRDALPEYPRDELLDQEFDILGHFLSDHPLSGMRRGLFDARQYFSGTILDPARTPPRQATMPAVVVSTDVRRTKAGDLMVVVVLCDPDRTYEALCFADAWSDLRECMRRKARLELRMTVIADGTERRLMIESGRVLAASETGVATRIAATRKPARKPAASRPQATLV